GLVLLLALLVAALARQIGVLHMRLGPRGALEVDEEGPPLGEMPPPAEVVDLEGAARRVGGPGAPTLLLFVSPGCPICREVLPGVAPAARAGDLHPLVLVDDDRPEALRVYRERDPRVPVAGAPGVAELYDVPGTPFAVVLDAAGAVRAKGTVNTLEQMEGLVDTARRRLEAAS
ncbi:MAG TPA: hypothetical protein VF097_05160, partial [Actinomycetota bacterium]